MSYPILLVKNLNYNIGSDELYQLFGKYGAIQQIRLGNNQDTKGTAFVIYEDMADAKAAKTKLEGYNFNGRYLVVSFYQLDKQTADDNDLEERKRRLEELKKQHNIE